MRVGLPVVRAVAQVRQPQRAAVEGRRARGDGPHARAAVDARSRAPACRRTGRAADACRDAAVPRARALARPGRDGGRVRAARPGLRLGGRRRPSRRRSPEARCSALRRARWPRSCGSRVGGGHERRGSRASPCASGSTSPAGSSRASSSSRGAGAPSCWSSGACARARPSWPAGGAEPGSRPGVTACASHARGPSGLTLARTARAPGRAALTVRAPAARRPRRPRPAAPPPTAVFPVAGPHTLRRRLRRRPQRLHAPGPGPRGRRGRRPSSRRWRAPISAVDYQAEGAGVLRRREGQPTATTSSSPIASRRPRACSPASPSPPASRSARSGGRATRPGRTCTSRSGSAAGAPARPAGRSTRSRCCARGSGSPRRGTLSATAEAQLAGDAGEREAREADEVAEAVAQLGRQRRAAEQQAAGVVRGESRGERAARARRRRRGARRGGRAQVGAGIGREHERAPEDAGAGHEVAVLLDRVRAVARPVDAHVGQPARADQARERVEPAELRRASPRGRAAPCAR